MLNFIFSKILILGLMLYIFKFIKNKKYQVLFVFIILICTYINIGVSNYLINYINNITQDYTFDLMGFTLFVLSTVTCIFCLFFIDLKLSK